MFALAKALAVCAVGLFCVSGCGGGDGPQLAKAVGTVNHNGQPVAGAKVVFAGDQGAVSMGTTDDQGRFELQTRGEPGAPIGNHQVTIIALERIGGELTEDGDEGETSAQVRSLIPQKYSNTETSGLTAEVTGDPAQNEFTFNLD